MGKQKHRKMAEMSESMHHDLLHVKMFKAVEDGDEFVISLIQCFQYGDEEGSANLSKAEMKEAIKQNKMTNQYMKDIDTDKGGHICVEEWVDYWSGARDARKKKKERKPEEAVVKDVKRTFGIPEDFQRKEKSAAPTKSYTFDRGTTTTLGGVDASSVRVGEWQKC